MRRESLGFFFIEYLAMSLVFSGYLDVFPCLRFSWVYRYSSYVVAIWVGPSWNVSISRNENHPFRVFSSEDYGELCMVNPPLFSIDFGLYGREPGVS